MMHGQKNIKSSDIYLRGFYWMFLDSALKCTDNT